METSAFVAVQRTSLRTLGHGLELRDHALHDLLCRLLKLPAAAHLEEQSVVGELVRRIASLQILERLQVIVEGEELGFTLNLLTISIVSGSGT
jgi:hypothetical protein